MIQGQKRSQGQFNGFNAPLSEMSHQSNVLHNNLETKFPCRMPYQPRSESKHLLSEIPLDQFHTCSGPSRDAIKENRQPSSPKPFRTWFPSPRDNSSSTSMSDIELAMSDDDGQNNVLHSARGKSSSYRGKMDYFNRPAQSPKEFTIEQCTDICCDKGDLCHWHTLVLKFPQYIVWEQVRTVEMKRSKMEFFGMGTKFKELRVDLIKPNVSTLFFYFML